MKRLRSFVACGVLAGLVVAASVDAAEPPSDAQALQQLQKSGSDLSKLHRVEYQLRFAAEDDATGAAMRLEDLAFAVTLERDDAHGGWVVLAAKRMYPVETDLRQLSDKVKNVTSDAHGTYEGWRASRIK